MENKREELVYMAKLSDKIDRYDDLVEFMKQVAQLDVELTRDERTLLFVGYRNVIGTRRGAWRALASDEIRQEANPNEENVRRIKEYRHRIEDELTQISNDVLSIIEKHLIPLSSTVESSVFYYKMKADYHRYQAEFMVGADRKEAADQALQAYEFAMTCSSDLPPAHPTYIGLALNLAVFYYEIMNNQERAIDLANKTFADSMAELDTLNEDDYRESTNVMQVIRDNLSIWIQHLPDEEGHSSKVEESEKLQKVIHDT